MDNSGHIPVLFDAVLAYLQPHPQGVYLDGTLGAGGHTAGILEKSAPSGRVLAFDKDPEAIAFAKTRLARFGSRVTFVRHSYAAMKVQAAAHGFDRFDGILLDLGLSSRQLADADRGFSFLKAGPLDMRFDPTQGHTAADLVNGLSADELADIFWRYGEESHSRRIARLIVEQRQQSPLQRTDQLAELIAAHSRRRGHRHPATQVFQALRIAVNDELGEVEKGVAAAIELLNPGGRLAVISFHSLEDRYVKRTFRQLSQGPTAPPGFPGGDRPPAVLRLITRKAVKADETELAANPRSRSARLRVVEKIERQVDCGTGYT